MSVHRVKGLAVAFCVLLVPGGSASAVDGNPSRSAPAGGGNIVTGAIARQVGDEPAEGVIGPADTLDVRVFADDLGGALSGKFVVADSGIVSFPVIGALSASGLVPGALQERISRRVCEMLFVPSIVAVSIVEFAPVFVLGEVSNRGPVEFEPGMTVFDLLAHAGGFDQDRDKGELSLRLEELRLARQQLLARRQRLLAEIDGRSELDMSSFDADGPLRDVVESEIHAFTHRLHSDNEARQSLLRQSDILRSETQLLNRRLALNGDETKILSEMSDRQNLLTEKGMVARAKFDETRLDLIRAEANGLELRTELVRAEQELSLVERQIGDLRNSRSVAGSVELTEVDRELGLKAAEIEGLQSMIHAQPLGSTEASESGDPDLRLVLYRSVGGERRSRTVAASYPLERGDVLVVSRSAESPEMLLARPSETAAQ